MHGASSVWCPRSTAPITNSFMAVVAHGANINVQTYVRVNPPTWRERRVNRTGLKWDVFWTKQARRTSIRSIKRRKTPNLESNEKQYIVDRISFSLTLSILPTGGYLHNESKTIRILTTAPVDHADSWSDKQINPAHFLRPVRNNCASDSSSLCAIRASRGNVANYNKQRNCANNRQTEQIVNRV